MRWITQNFNLILSLPQGIFGSFYINKNQPTTGLQYPPISANTCRTSGKWWKAGRDITRLKLHSKNGIPAASSNTKVILWSSAFSASTFPTDSIAGVISRQTTFCAYGAMARPHTFLRQPPRQNRLSEEWLPIQCDQDSPAGWNSIGCFQSRPPAVWMPAE